MNGIVFPGASAVAASGLLNAYNARLGYPRAATSRGAACPPHPFGQTVTCANTITHPTLPQIAIQESNEMAAVEGVVGIGAGSKQTLDATWFPAASVGQ